MEFLQALNEPPHLSGRRATSIIPASICQVGPAVQREMVIELRW